MITVALLDHAADAAPMLRLLRDRLDEATFARRLARAEDQGYRVLAAYDGERMVGALGYRLTDDLFWGRSFYVDDLVVDPARRSAGIGAALLDHARELAASCDHLRLCSGLNRTDAHRFYEANGMTRFSVQFITALHGAS